MPVTLSCGITLTDGDVTLLRAAMGNQALQSALNAGPVPTSEPLPGIVVTDNFAPQPPQPPMPQATDYPKLVKVDGVNMVLDAPLNPGWKPGLMARVFGSLRNQVRDPSNGGLLGMPPRSPAGYPLVYGVGGDGKAVSPPRVAYDDHTFATDAEVESYIIRMAGAQSRASIPSPRAAPPHSAPPAPPAPAAAPSAASVPAPPGPHTEPLPSYPDVPALKADLLALGFPVAVTVDGTVIHEGFGPPVSYTSFPDRVARNT